MAKIKWIAPLFLALALAWWHTAPAAAQTPTPTPVPPCFTAGYDGSSGESWYYSEQLSTSGSGSLGYADGGIELHHTIPNGHQTHYAWANQDVEFDLTDATNLEVTFEARSAAPVGKLNNIGLSLWLEYDDATTQSIPMFTIINGLAAMPDYDTFSFDLTSFSHKNVVSFAIGGSNSTTSSGSDEKWLYLKNIDLTVTCPEAPQGTVLCPLVENANFSAADGWSLVGIAEISGGYLTMAGVGSASQNVTVQPLLTYNSVISVTSATSATLGVSLGSQGEVLSVNRGTYTSTFTTPGVIGGPLEYLLENQSASAIQINFACIQLADGTGERVCIAPDNGEFDTAAGWFEEAGASFNSQQQNYFLPYETNGQIQSTKTYSLPTLASGEYLIYSWDAQSIASTGLIGGALADTTNNEWFAGYANTYAEWYTYEFDVSDFAEQAVRLRFLAPGIDPVTETQIDGDVRVDNACIFVSDQPPRLPFPSDPDAPPSVELGEFYSCDDIDQIIWDLVGVDMRYHRENYAETPGFFDFSDWVPWLVSAFWVAISFYVCLFFVLIQTIINIVEYIANNILNIFNWFYVTAVSFLTNWLPTTISNILRTGFNFGKALLITLWDWGLWIGLAAIAFGFFLPAAFLFVLFGGLLWLYYGLVWIAEYFSEFFDWLTIEFFNFFKGDLLNNLILAWNAFSETIGEIFSWIYDTFIVWLWNPIIVPFLETLLGMFLPIFSLASLIGKILTTIPVIWGFVFSVVMWLWENVWQIINMPLSFYIGLQSGVQSNAFGSLLDCAGGESFWCAYLAGLDLVNAIAGQSIFYPIVIVTVILGTFMVFKKHGGAGWEIIIKSLENF